MEIDQGSFEKGDADIGSPDEIDTLSSEPHFKGGESGFEGEGESAEAAVLVHVFGSLIVWQF